ncbi:hypothetical protein CAK95_09615 [Pseudorhodoplanes sinuspersici]|uniref:DUF2842 domain-containing protein n=2 Tax=Pseudorhodoplanes sinuspersici TaxID=1235591 RepID=A0A1W6ZPL1_9HYPH|nr:hypothetical protein CAK95_09615 [Pseudorhodoplanes sinuspersici]
MALYAIIAFVLQALSVAVIYMFESALGTWSAVVFITTYLLMFWVAWPIALRLTEPKVEAVASAQKA